MIPILLPALGKARQTANKASCLSNLHNIGIAMAMYENQYRGSLPYSRGIFDSASNELTWGSLLSQIMGMNKGGTAQTALDSSQLGSRAVFICKDGPSVPGAIGANQYSAHPLVMPNAGYTSYANQKADSGALNWYNDPAAFGANAGQHRRPYKVGRIPNPSELVVIWDGVCFISPGTSSGGVGQAAASADGYALDQQRITNVTDQPTTYLLSTYAQSKGVDLGASVNGGQNIDSASGSNTDRVLGNIRWRHMGDSAANFLFADGHAASINYGGRGRTAAANTETHKTGLLRRNVCIPAPQ